MINAAVLGLVLLISFLMGAFFILGYLLWRMMRNDGWDDSNITNALRLLSHVILHAEDFGKMYYLSSKQYGELVLAGIDPAKFKRPFWYVDKDEFEGVVKTRP